MKKLILLIFCLLNLSLYAQDQQLAFDYYRKGEYDKAASIFKSLYRQNNFNSNYLQRYVLCQQQLENFDEAQKSIELHLEAFPNQIHFYVELGYNYELQYLHEEAKVEYEKALSLLPNNLNYTYSVGRSFKNNHQLDYALKTYELATQINPNANYELQIAPIYGEKGNTEKMFNTYLDLVEKNERYGKTILRYLSNYITEDAQSIYNKQFRIAVLKRLQQSPNVAWNELLAWLYMQQKDFDKAFVQIKAVYQRNPEMLSGISNLCNIAFDSQDYETAAKCADFILENTTNPTEKVDANLILLQIDIALNKNREEVSNKFDALLTQFGVTPNTLQIQLAYADFLTFKIDNPIDAFNVLERALNLPLNKFQKGQTKLKIGDVLVFQGKFNEALIYYSQVQTQLKNHQLAQEARYKVAQTSFYKGDFDWAQTQLKVLKSATSQLIANDALDLSLIIDDNTVKDSLKLALKSYAKADLLSYQSKNEEAIAILKELVVNQKGHAIEDEAHYQLGLLNIKLENYNLAIQHFLTVTELDKTDILVDDAYFQLGEIYLQLNNTEKAKEYFQKIIFEFPSSIYLVPARRQYRKLRGDDIQ
ncbi:tetratricopeptide repeat protein [Urechidicola sp. KH5]